MAKFVLIDHSLRGVGGHHYEYAVHVLRAAQDAGYQITLASHRGFRDGGSLPADWQVWPLFRYGIYGQHAVAWGRGPRQPTPPSPRRAPWSALCRIARRAHPRTWLTASRQLAGRIDRHRRLESFAACCDQLFRRVILTDGDQVFLPTLSDFDLHGLVRFLARSPGTQAATWHLQFHFDILAGRPPQYRDQLDRLATSREHFQSALDQVPHHRLCLYSTTPQMAAQYNLLGVGRFRELPYPINPAFHRPGPPRPVGRPLRVTCAGVMRREKGRGELAQLIERLWQPHLRTGQLQFLIQADRRRFRQLVPPAQRRRFGRTEPCDPDAPPPLVRVAHPLGMEDFVQLVRQSDIGMFLYDGRAYYARFSGILAEMLAAGVPVIVPAGCWLAEQIAEPIWQYLDQLEQSAPVLTRWDAGRLGWRGLGEGGTLACGSGESAIVGQLAVPPRASALRIAFRWLGCEPAGTYVRLEAESHDTAGQTLERFAWVLGQRAGGHHVSALCSLPSGTAAVRLTWQNAYQNDRLVLGDLRLSLLGPSDGPDGRYPLGAVGLIAADHRQVPSLLEEMARHTAHYRHTALAFSRQWLPAHDPRRTLEMLEGEDHAARPAHPHIQPT